MEREDLAEQFFGARSFARLKPSRSIETKSAPRYR
jgi:hypothetical protein